MREAAVQATLVGIGAFTASVLVLAVAIRAAPRLGMVGRPDPSVPNHVRDVPLLGGLGALAGAAVGAWAADWSGIARGSVLAAMGAAIALGAYKDRVGVSVSSWLQLAVQSCAVLLALHGIGVPPIVGVQEVDAAAWALFGLWLVNSVNFLDVMDGLAAGTCAIAAIGATIILWDDPAGRPVSAGIACGLAGFLVFNIHPARMFMGDVGSFGVGMMLFAVCLRISSRAPAASAILLLGVPLLEVVVSSALRLAKGVSPLRGDGTHPSLELLRRGVAVPRIVAGYWVAEAACVAAAVAVASASVG